jgi:hypothetical protein
MAQRRMFSLKVVDTDAFMDMPSSSQLLYFHLAMRGDDDGFVANPKKILRMIGANEDDYKVLIAKKFVIQFDSGVCVIKHWRIHNYLQNDRYSSTQYVKELEFLKIDEKTKKYSLILNKKEECIQNDYKMYTELNLTKLNLTKPNIDREDTPFKITSKFFNSLEEQERVIQELILKCYEPTITKQEIVKFISYWTEPNKSGSKQRWEMEETFEISRRLATWFSRISTFNQSNKSKYVTI